MRMRYVEIGNAVDADCSIRGTRTMTPNDFARWVLAKNEEDCRDCYMPDAQRDRSSTCQDDRRLPSRSL